MRDDLEDRLAARIRFYITKFEEVDISNGEKKQTAGEKFSRLSELKQDLRESEALLNYLRNMLEE